MRIRLKKKYHFPKPKKINLILIILTLLFIILFLAFKYIDKRVTPLLLNYGETEVKKLTSIIMNKAINDQLVNSTDINKLFIVTTDEEGLIKMVDFDPVLINKFLTVTMSYVHKNLRYVEKGQIDLLEFPTEELFEYETKNLKKGITYEIPSGVVFNNSLLSNLGPKIPVRLSLSGATESNIKTKITNYGINNALIEVNIILEVDLQIILPFASKLLHVSTEVPVAMKLVQGRVPTYYSGGLTQDSPRVILPVE